MQTSPYVTTRDAIHRVAVHVVARARVEAAGRFSLRVTPGGLGTPEFDQRRVRIADGRLIVESDAPGAPAATGRAVDGATLRELAELAGVDLGVPLDVGHDTPPLGDPDVSIELDERAAGELGHFYALAGRALDRVVVETAVADGVTTLPRLWPEHFDVAIETVARPGQRVNLGAAPGDAFHAAPYWYVGPWTDLRPGDPAFWNAPFGAFQPVTALDPAGVEEGVDFLLDGLGRIAAGV